jgi:hypothetical protein
MPDFDFVGNAMDKAVAHWLKGIEAAFRWAGSESFTGAQVADFIEKLRAEKLKDR